MASLSTLPTELQLEIIEMIYANIPTPNLFGKNAAWILPEHDENDFQYYKPTRLLTIDDSKAEFDSSEESDKSDEMKVAKELEESNKPDEIMAAPNGAMISNPLLALRLVSSEWNELCIPFIFRTVDLYQWDTWTELYRAMECAIIPYARHIRFLRLLLRPMDDLISEFYKKFAEEMSLCTNLIGLSVYFDAEYYSLEDGPEFTALIPAICHLLCKGHLKALGIYSKVAIEVDIEIGDEEIFDTPPANLLVQLTQLPEIVRLERLDVSIPVLTDEAFDLVRNNCVSLKTLAFRRGLILPLGRIWDVNQQTKWRPNENLTVLRLSGCHTAYASHIPYLVLLFSSLKELVVDGCGHLSDWAPQLQRRGWSRDPDSLPNKRAPLDLLHIEHAADWELMALGIIPTKTLILTLVLEEVLCDVIGGPVEMFVGVQKLRVYPAKAPGGKLEAICEQRQITLVRDAEILRKCLCHPEIFDI